VVKGGLLPGTLGFARGNPPTLVVFFGVNPLSSGPLPQGLEHLDQLGIAPLLGCAHELAK